MSAEVDVGGTQREHLMSHWRQEGYDPDKMPVQLQSIECPEPVAYLWEYFLDMSRRRTSNGFGVNPIPHEGVEAWARRKGITLLPFENDILDEIEGVYVSASNKAAKARKAK